MTKTTLINTLDKTEKIGDKVIHTAGIGVAALSALPLILTLPAIPGTIIFLSSIASADYLFDKILKIGK